MSQGHVTYLLALFKDLHCTPCTSSYVQMELDPGIILLSLSQKKTKMSFGSWVLGLQLPAVNADCEIVRKQSAKVKDLHPHKKVKNEEACRYYSVPVG